MNWGFMDTRGRDVIAPKYEHASNFREGVAPVVIDGLTGYIDTNEKFVIPPRYGPESSSVNEDSVALELSNSKIILADTMGNRLSVDEFDYAEPFSHGFALVEMNGRKSFLARGGGELQLAIRDASSFADGFAAVELDDGWYYVTPDGKRRFGPFTHASDWRFGFALVSRNDERLVLRRDGTTRQIPHTVEWCGSYGEDLFAFRRNGAFGFMDFMGTEVIPADFEQVNFFLESIAMVKRDGRWGAIDSKGGWILRPVFEKAQFFKCGLCLVESNQLQYFIDKNGNRLQHSNALLYHHFTENLAPFATEIE